MNSLPLTRVGAGDVSVVHGIGLPWEGHARITITAVVNPIQAKSTVFELQLRQARLGEQEWQVFRQWKTGNQ